MQILHVIDFEGSRQIGIKEYGIVTVSFCEDSRRPQNFEILDTKTAICIENFEDHVKIFTDLRRTGTFVGHNASVEDRLLRHHVPSPGSVKNFSKIEKTTNTWGPWIDTLVLYKNLFRSIDDFSLKNLINRFDLSENLLRLSGNFCQPRMIGYHNALFDALSTYLLLDNFVRKLGASKIVSSVAMLVEYSKKTGLC